MAYVVEITDPFQPLKGMRHHKVEEVVTVRQWLEKTYPGFTEFETPTICLLNGEPLLRAQWTERQLGPKDVVNFIPCAGEVVTWIAVISVVISVASTIAAVLLAPSTPGAQPASEPVFSAGGQQNALRLNEPIETSYGRNRIYPSYAARPFFRYVGNDQFQHSLYCIGQGEYDVHQIQIGDADINTYDEVEYELLGPGQKTELFATSVYTADEVGGQQLYGPGVPEYPLPDGWVGPFVASAPQTKSVKIEVDIVYPRGITFIDKKGRVGYATVTHEVEYREIDDGGAPVGGWMALLTINETNATTTPVRRTYSQDVTPARYEVRLRRITYNYPNNNRANIDSQWEALRSFLEDDDSIDYGNLTMLAVKVRATNNLNSKTQEKFNVIATRKIPMRDSGGAWHLVPSRSIVWAFIDVLRATYGGRVTDERLFDWDALEDLDAFYEARGNYFDWCFRDPITIWEACQTICRVGRAIPMIAGNIFSIVRDGPAALPVTIFNPDVIVKDSFSWQVRLWEPLEFDSVEIEYTEPATGFKQETVLCILPGGSGNNPDHIRLAGVTERQQAYEEGLFILASKLYCRQNFTFTTGLEGYLPVYGDLIGISHDVPEWGQGGIVVDATMESSGDWLLLLSEPLKWADTGTHQILFRRKNGDPLGPFDATPGPLPQQVIIAGYTIDFLLTGLTEPMIYAFGVTGNVVTYAKVVKIEPQGREEIRITCTNDAPIIHTFDGLPAPALKFPSIPPIVPDLPEISKLTLSQLESGLLIIQASWLAAFGAQYYLVQSSTDGINWTLEGTTPRTSLQFQTSPGDIWVRVAAMNNGQGPWIMDTIVISLVLGLRISTPWDYLSWAIDWWEDFTVDGYQVRVYDASNESNLVLKRTENIVVFGYLYDYVKAIADSNLVRHMVVEVDTRVYNEETDTVELSNMPRHLTLHNAIPPAPTSITLASIDAGSSGLELVIEWDNPATEDDLYRVEVWVEPVSGFNPLTTPPRFSFTAPTPGAANVVEQGVVEWLGVIIPDLYCRVAVYDIWGSEIESNLADEVTFTFPWILAGGEWNDIARWEDTETWKDS